MSDWFTSCSLNNYEYPKNKIEIKNEIIDMLRILDETAQNYIEYCFDNDYYDELYTILEYWEEFGMTQQECDRLMQNIVMWKLIS